MTNAPPQETSAAIGERVQRARAAQRERWSTVGRATNGAVPGPVLLVSEYPPDQTPMKYRFLARNRLIDLSVGE